MIHGILKSIVLRVLRYFGVTDDANVQGAVAELEEINIKSFTVNVIHLLTQLPDLLTDILQLLPGGTVGDAQQELDAVLLTLGVVGDGCVAQEIVGHIHQFLIKRPDAGAAERNFFHDAFHIVGGNPVADHKGTLRDDDNAAENVSQGILGGKGDGHGANTQRGNECGDVVVPFLGYHDNAQHDAQHMCQSGNQLADGFVNVLVGTLQQLHDESVPCVAQIVHASDEADDQAAAQDLIKRRMLGKRTQGAEDDEGIKSQNPQKSLDGMVKGLREAVDIIIMVPLF